MPFIYTKMEIPCSKYDTLTYLAWKLKETLEVLDICGFSEYGVEWLKVLVFFFYILCI